MRTVLTTCGAARRHCGTFRSGNALIRTSWRVVGFPEHHSQIGQLCGVQRKSTRQNCYTFQHIATHFYTLLHIATHCYTLLHISTHCYTLSTSHYISQSIVQFSHFVIVTFISDLQIIINEHLLIATIN